jgi:hypothetical protein
MEKGKCKSPKQIKLSKIAKKAVRDEKGRFSKSCETAFDNMFTINDVSVSNQLAEMSNKLDRILEKLESK